MKAEPIMDVLDAVEGVRERPILFSAPMVRAILAGTKTQTRRVMTRQPSDDTTVVVERFNQTMVDRHGDEQPGPEVFGAWWHDGESGLKSPYGGPGERLWVRETFAHIYTGNGTPDARRSDDVVYRADGHGIDSYAFGPWCPSIHMPRWASRITLNITGVRVERLQAISEEDAGSEGVDYDPGEGGVFWVPGLGCDSDRAADSFRQLWESINGTASWDANPYVWVVSFQRIAS